MSGVVRPSFLVAWSASAMCFESSCTSALLSHVALCFQILGTSVCEMGCVFPQILVVVHDDACHMRRYTTNSQDHEELQAQIAHPMVTYVLDRFDARGHLDAWCRATCCTTSPQMQDIVADAVTSICEITFAWLAKYKHMVRKMWKHIAHFLRGTQVEVQLANFTLKICESNFPKHMSWRSTCSTRLPRTLFF